MSTLMEIDASSFVLGLLTTPHCCFTRLKIELTTMDEFDNTLFFHYSVGEENSFLKTRLYAC